MRYNTGFSSYSPKTVQNFGSREDSSEVEYGRVLDVVLDVSHPKIKSLGGTQALYGVYYQPLFVDAEDDLEKVQKDPQLRFAYFGNQAVRQIPIKNEIVRIESRISSVASEENFESDGQTTKRYWTEIVPLWNTPHLNIYPDKPHQSSPDLGKDFRENQDIKPLQLNPGDVTIEGRHGQSLRFGGTKSSNNKFVEESSNGKPYTILRNGQASCQEDTCFEDVDKDDSSIYLTSDHKVPVTEANRRFKGAVKVPEIAKNYKGKQIVVNSDRVVVNAREDNLVLAAKKHASVNAETTSIDGEQYVGLDANKVYLGNFAQKEQNPVLKGQVSVDFLKDLYNILHTWFQGQGTALSTSGATAWEKAAGAATLMTATQLQTLFARIDQLKSKKVYTE